jgi:hypothetical protein
LKQALRNPLKSLSPNTKGALCLIGALGSLTLSDSIHTRRSAAIGLGMLMRDGKLTEARPARRPANSRPRASKAPCIRRLISLMSGSDTANPHFLLS